MTDLTRQECNSICGGDAKCAFAILGLGISVIGAGISLATLNPVGTILGVGGIYAGLPSMLMACDLVGE